MNQGNGFPPNFQGGPSFQPGPAPAVQPAYGGPPAGFQPGPHGPAPVTPGPQFQGGAPAPAAAPTGPAPGRFTGANGRQASVTGQYFDLNTDGGPGAYLCKIVDVKDINTQKSGAAVVFELEVVESTRPDKVPPGSKRSVFQDFKDRNVAFQNLLGYVAAAIGADVSIPEQLAWVNTELSQRLESELEGACYRKSLNGKYVIVSTMPHTTRRGQLITRCRFSPKR